MLPKRVASFTLRMTQIQNSAGSDLFKPQLYSPISKFLTTINCTNVLPRDLLKGLPDYSSLMLAPDASHVDESMKVTLRGYESEINFCKCRLMCLDYFQRLFNSDLKANTPCTIPVEMGVLSLDLFYNFFFTKSFTESQCIQLLDDYESLLELLYAADFFNISLLSKWCVMLIDYMQFIPKVWDDFPRLWCCYITCRAVAHIEGVPLLLGKLEIFLCLIFRSHGEIRFKECINLGERKNANAFLRIKALTNGQFFINGLVTSIKLVSVYIDEKNDF